MTMLHNKPSKIGESIVIYSVYIDFSFPAYLVYIFLESVSVKLGAVAPHIFSAGCEKLIHKHELA